MATLPPGGAGRTATLGTGTSRSRSVVVGRPGRGTTIPTPLQQIVGTSGGLSTAAGVSDFVIIGNTLLKEDDDQILQETGEFLLLEDAASTGTVNDIALFIRGVGAALADAEGRSDGVASASGVLEEPSASGDALLQEDDFSILQEDDDFILLETGAVPPPGVLLDMNGEEISDVNGEFITGV